MSPTPGYIPRYVVSNLDMPQYVAWMKLASTHWLLPNVHSPWATEDALFTPLVVIAGKLSYTMGLSPVVGFHAFQLLFYIVAALALGTAVRTFCPTRRQQVGVAVAIFCALPIPLLVLGWARTFGKDLPLFWIGLVEYSYETADGLFRGGMSNSFTLSFGTAAALFAIALLARLLRERRRRHLVLLTLVVFLSALFHPFEVFVITAVSLFSFGLAAFREGNPALLLRYGAPVSVAAFAGMLPYAIQGSRHQWLRDISHLSHWHPGSVLWVGIAFGIPVVLAIYLLFMRFPLRAAYDEVLRTWLVATVALAFVPVIPGREHLFDGFPYIVAILLVRLAAGHAQTVRAIYARPRLAYALAIGAVLLCAPGYATLYAQILSDGRAVNPKILINALQRQEEPALLDWFRRYADHEQLVMGPPETSAWLATVPMPSMASHDLFSFTYEQQAAFINNFYEGKLSDTEAAQALSRYGIHYVVLPLDSPGLRFMTDRKMLARVGPWSIYEIPEGRRLRYPGLASVQARAR